MRWRLFATLAETAGETTVDVSPPERTDGGVLTVEDALSALLDAEPALETEVLDEDGSLADHIQLLHEGQDPTTTDEGMDRTVEPDDELALFPPVSGG